MRFLSLLRHGQTEPSRQHLYCGTLDPPLTPDGLRMAECFASASSGYRAIYCSPLLRTRQTAAPVADKLGLSPHFDANLREIAYGQWEGLSQEQAQGGWPEVYAAWTLDGAAHPPPGGETALEVAARVDRALSAILAAEPEGEILVVAHKATLRILSCLLLGIDPRSFRERIDFPVLSLTRFEILSSGARLVSAGDRSHLPSFLRDQPGS